MPLGVSADAAWKTHLVALEPGAVVVFYTDGMLEFERDVFRAEEKLLLAAASIAQADSRAMPAELVKQFVMENACATDDVAILVLQCREHATIHPQIARGTAA